MKNILIIIVALAALGAGYWYLSGHAMGTIAVPDISFSASSTATTSNQQGDALMNNDTAQYSDPDFHFSLSYPSDLEVHVYPEDNGGRTVAFEGASPGEGFQVYVQPYSDTKITDQQFRTDEPSGVMKDPQDIQIDGAPAKIFYGHNDAMGGTREVWFIHNGLLYEIMTYKPLDNWLGTIMTTFHFI